jgi:hypothetical protein
VAKSKQRRSWFSSVLPLHLLAPEVVAPRRSIRTQLRVESLEAREVPAITLVGAPTWVEQGGVITGSSSLSQNPTPTLNNQTTGAVNAVTASYSNPNLLYAGGVNGGVWRSLDGGANWTPLTDAMPSASIAKIAINPFTTSNVIAGLGANSAGGAEGYAN